MAAIPRSRRYIGIQTFHSLLQVCVSATRALFYRIGQTGIAVGSETTQTDVRETAFGR